MTTAFSIYSYQSSMKKRVGLETGLNPYTTIQYT